MKLLSRTSRVASGRRAGQAMTALPPDPDPAETSASSNQNPPPGRPLTPITITALVAVGVLFAVFLTVAVLYLLQLAGLMDR